LPLQPYPPLSSASKDAALSAVVRMELEWARYNNIQEADAVFNSQQVCRTNLYSSILKAYDIYRDHWLVSWVSFLASLYY
jgi:hypothetical protein